MRRKSGIAGGQVSQGQARSHWRASRPGVCGGVRWQMPRWLRLQGSSLSCHERRDGASHGQLGSMCKAAGGFRQGSRRGGGLQGPHPAQPPLHRSLAFVSSAVRIFSMSRDVGCSAEGRQRGVRVSTCGKGCVRVGCCTCGMRSRQYQVFVLSDKLEVGFSCGAVLAGTAARSCGWLPSHFATRLRTIVDRSVPTSIRVQ